MEKKLIKAEPDYNYFLPLNSPLPHKLQDYEIKRLKKV